MICPTAELLVDRGLSGIDWKNLAGFNEGNVTPLSIFINVWNAFAVLLCGKCIIWGGDFNISCGKINILCGYINM